MSDFESYLERYQEIISDFRSQYLQSHNSMSLFNSKELRTLLHDDEVPRFSAMLYVTNLLSQVVHFYGVKVFGLNPHLDSKSSPFDWEDRVNTFPEIYGILGFYGPHLPCKCAKVIWDGIRPDQRCRAIGDRPSPWPHPPPSTRTKNLQRQARLPKDKCARPSAILALQSSRFAERILIWIFWTCLKRK